jgi:hypothetical protein
MGGPWPGAIAPQDIEIGCVGHRRFRLKNRFDPIPEFHGVSLQIWDSALSLQ